MNQIKGIDKVAREVRRGERDPDFRRACIRDYIKDHPNEPVTLQDLAKAAYGHDSNIGYTGTLVKKLIKQGRITRTRLYDGSKGRHYKYQWHEQRMPSEKPHNGPVSTRPLEGFEKSDNKGYSGIMEEEVEKVINTLMGEDRKEEATTIRTLFNKYLRVKGQNLGMLMASNRDITININGEKQNESQT